MMKILTLLVFMSATLFAQPRWLDREGERGGGRWFALTDQLNLTGEQDKQVTKLHDELQKRQIATQSKIGSLRVDLRSMFREEKPDQGKIESAIQDIGKLQTEMKLSHTNFWFSVNKILTPEQQKVWKESPATGGYGKGEMKKKFKMNKRMRMMRNDERDDD